MISCRHLSKYYGELTAVSDLSFEVPPGAICALIGPNGSGKSTTLGMLAGVVEPTSGEASVSGIDVHKDPVALKKRIGVLPEGLGLFDALTVEEHLRLTASVYGVPKQEARLRTEQLLRVLSLDEARRTFADSCSHGMRKKTALAMALLPNPRALLLDEPFEAIDPAAAQTISTLLRTAARRGVTIFLTSHILGLVEQLADRTLLIQRGRVEWDSQGARSPDSLHEHYLDIVETAVEEDLEWLGHGES